MLVALDLDLGARVLAEEDAIPGVDLEFYRVRASFRADYGRVAAFLGGIDGIERALSVHSLDVRPDGEGVKVELKLDVYLSEAAGS